jgi:3-oxoacyl-[acyl-carrier protein] reductase
MALLANRVILVTGASRGIGAATARLLAAHGAAVGVDYLRSAAAAERVVAEILAAGGRALAVRADVRVEAEVRAMVAEVERAFGPIDTLVSNAAIEFAVKPFVEYRWEEFEAKLVDELKAAFLCSQAVIPGMISRRRGCLIFVSSGLARVPGQGMSAHSTAKAGLDSFVKSLALELGQHGVRCNVVAPGLTETDATAWMAAPVKEAAAKHNPMRRIAQPEDVAGAVLAIALEEMRFVTGTWLPVCGGAQMLP